MVHPVMIRWGQVKGEEDEKRRAKLVAGDVREEC